MTADTAQPPPGLRERLLAVARAARPPGRPVPAAPEITAVEAFGRAVDALDATLGVLAPEQWRVPVLRDLDVQGLVGHLTGVETDVQRALSGDPDVACADHVASTQDAAVAQAGRAPAETRRGWRAAADATMATVDDEADFGRVVSMHGMQLPLGPLLVVRAFELWTHENDIRAAVGLPAGAPDASTLPLMTGLAAQLLPHGVARIDTGSAPVDLHLVLTGSGGGTWDIAIGERAEGTSDDVPEVTVVAGAVAFCRLVANRIQPADLRPRLGGAVAEAPRVLAGAAALALD